MNIKKLMSTALLLLVGAGSAVAAVGDESLPPAYDDAAVSVSSESENVGFQSGGWTEIGLGYESGNNIARGTGQTIPQQVANQTALAVVDPAKFNVFTLRDLVKTSPAKNGMQGFTGGLHFGYDCKLRDMAATIGFFARRGFWDRKGSDFLSYILFVRC